MKDKEYLAFMLAFLVGIMLLIYAVNKIIKQVDFLKSGRSAVATVFRIDTVESDGHETYKPVFVFRTPAGQSFIYDNYFNSAPISWKIGDQARVVYNPADPRQAKVLTFFEAFGASPFLFLLALALIIFSGGYMWAEQFFTSLG
ncbi:DUF3592 domain-containing protein [Hymenobacter sp. BT18]|uniref:DUF3592 domain-containing protein n=1 Tax=Hymenobacter sp. BT18 TaxID=2835648 RepID=UPI00143EB193|nr:DUF3592 domain-containing protein [Hymenobacter sp. BT18]QIX60778.1 DUF3592 domain-containing protein [Hymenobacter sp. BT18]